MLPPTPYNIQYNIVNGKKEESKKLEGGDVR